MLFENDGNEFQPADPAHVYVTNNQIEVAWGQQFKRRFSGLGSGAVVLTTQQSSQKISHLLIIVDDEERRLMFAGFNHDFFKWKKRRLIADPAWMVGRRTDLPD